MVPATAVTSIARNARSPSVASTSVRDGFSATMTAPSMPRNARAPPCPGDDDCGSEIDRDLLIAGCGLITECCGGRRVTEPAAMPEICGADRSGPELPRSE